MCRNYSREVCWFYATRLIDLFSRVCRSTGSFPSSSSVFCCFSLFVLLMRREADEDENDFVDGNRSSWTKMNNM